MGKHEDDYWPIDGPSRSGRMVWPPYVGRHRSDDPSDDQGDEIEIALRYLNRVRSMSVTPGTRRMLDQEIKELKGARARSRRAALAEFGDDE